MKRALWWMMLAVVCVAARAVAREPPSDARLQQAQAAFDEATKLQKEGRYAEGIAKGEQALALREAVLGGAHLEVAAGMQLLGVLHKQQGEYARAAPLIQRALAIREAALGKHHPEVASSLLTLATLYQAQGLYGKSEPLYQRALAIWEAALGKQHPNVAISLNNLANLYRDQGQYGKAEPLIQRALAIYEAALGKQHPEVAYSLHNLANLYNAQGQYGKAEPLYGRALAIREEALGKQHPEVATSLNNLANLYAEQGQYGKAEPLYERALAIYGAALGKQHPNVAASLNNLAALYAEQGQYGKAEPLYERALAIREAGLGKQHPEVATSLNNLALLYGDRGQYGKAESLIQRALTIYEAALGKQHSEVAYSLHNLAALYAEQGQYGKAEPLFERALAIREAGLGKRHPIVANSLANLALLYAEQGQYGKAEPLYGRALAILEAALGKHHPYVARSLNDSALLRLAQHRLTQALPLLTRAFTISEQRLRKEALDFSESRLANFLQFLRSEEERLYALLRVHPDNTAVQRLALSAVLLRKGRSLEEATNTSRTILRSLDPEERDSFERLRGLRTQLAQLSLQGPGASSPADYQKRLKELTEQGDVLEAELARRSAPLRALAALPSPSEIIERVAEALPKEGALVEFIEYEERPLVPKPGTPKAQLPTQLRYMALVLFPDERIRAVDLGPAGPIDEAASKLRNALAVRDAAIERPAQALYALVFKPLVAVLGSTRRLLLAPDGQLSLVPFAALHDGNSFLVDAYDFTYLTSGKEVLERPEGAPALSSVVVLADPDFSTPAAAVATTAVEAPAQVTRSAAVERFFSHLRAEVAEQAWAPLPGTRQEAEAIQRLIPQAQLYLGQQASKQQLIHLAAPGVLHIATHGFFLEDAAAPTGARGVAHQGSGVASRPPPDPLLRSGLVLSGARSPSSSASSVQSRAASTLVTALELAGVDLWGTQLVVLSACETGRGEVKRGQGVYGLRRALVTAGAETVVMSLWKVNDETTRQLMEEYYRNLLKGQGRAGALRNAMLWMRQKQPHPYAWAPFIALGSDAALRPLTPLPVQPPPVSSELLGAFHPVLGGNP
jgi:CHAT domain-containing protein/tetratricopeptide (TPR) repeat protein